MAYPDTATLVAGSSATELTSLTSDEQDALRAAAIAAVEHFCGQSFGGTVPELVVRPTTGKVLYLPRHAEAITAVLIDGAVASVDDLIIETSNSSSRVEFDTGRAPGYYEQALREMDPDWPRGWRGASRVTFTGTFGWSACPEAVEAAIRRDMEEQAVVDANALNPVITALRRQGVRGVNQGGLSLQLEADGPAVSGMVARLLDSFVWTGPAGRVV